MKIKKIICKDANKLYDWEMCQSLPYDEIKFEKNVELEDTFKTPDDSDKIYFIQCDLK